MRLMRSRVRLENAQNITSTRLVLSSRSSTTFDNTSDTSRFAVVTFALTISSLEN
jgi:hypothetical protein